MNITFAIIFELLFIEVVCMAHMKDLLLSENLLFYFAAPLTFFKLTLRFLKITSIQMETYLSYYQTLYLGALAGIDELLLRLTLEAAREGSVHIRSVHPFEVCVTHSHIDFMWLSGEHVLYVQLAVLCQQPSSRLSSRIHILRN